MRGFDASVQWFDPSECLNPDVYQLEHYKNPGRFVELDVGAEQGEGGLEQTKSVDLLEAEWGRWPE